MPVQAEYQAARSAVALVPRPWREIVVVRGEGRVAFLQGLLSNDIESVRPGDGCRALLLDVKGRVVGDLDVWADEDHLVVATSTLVVATVLATLRKYVLAAAVEFEERKGKEAVLGVVGPKSGELLRAVAAHVPEDSERAHTKTSIAGHILRVARTPALAAPGVELHVAVESVDAVLSELQAAVGGELPRAGEETAEILRVEAGVPAHGRELTGEQFPQEAHLDDAISYEKGCYLGQETVARIHYRGQVNRLLVGLALSTPAEPDTALAANDREVGSITSAVVSPVHGPVGLGFVRRELAVAGSELLLTTPDGQAARAEVVILPFPTAGE